MDDEVKSLLETILDYKPNEKVGLIWDENYEIVAKRIRDYCLSEGVLFREVAVGSSDETRGEMKECLTDPMTPIVIIAAKDIWHLKERKFAKYNLRKRLVNLLQGNGFSESCFIRGKMNDLGEQLYSLLKNAKKFRIYSESGTELTADIGKVFKETGDYGSSGNGGDLPAGEVGFGPIEGSVNGRIVYDFKVQHVGFVKDKPQIIEVHNDLIKFEKANKKFRHLINAHSILKYVSEISIGINPLWSEVKDKRYIVEEKNLGTAHFGHGGNLSYGSRAGPHFDGVILKPTIEIGDNLIMKNGVFDDRYISKKQFKLLRGGLI